VVRLVKARRSGIGPDRLAEESILNQHLTIITVNNTDWVTRLVELCVSEITSQALVLTKTLVIPTPNPTLCKPTSNMSSHRDSYPLGTFVETTYTGIIIRRVLTASLGFRGDAMLGMIHTFQLLWQESRRNKSTNRMEFVSMGHQSKETPVQRPSSFRS
jgi:hypothetical protein